MRSLLLPLLHSPCLLHPFFLPPALPIHLPPLCLLLPILLPLPAPSSPLPHVAPFLLDLANADRPLPPPLPVRPLDPTQTPLGMTIGAQKMTTFLSLSSAMNGFDPAGAISPPKCSAPESQIRARWAELLDLQRLATS